MGDPGTRSRWFFLLDEARPQLNPDDITVTDLPTRFHGARQRHGLTRLQQIERDAIKSALEACHNNKVHAAQQLGISRSTLYTRIREYGLG